MSRKEIFGTDQQGNTVTKYTLSHGKLTAEILDRGATVRALIFDGTDVVLGYDSVADYENNDGYLGATIGRCGNRIMGGKFKLGGKEYDVGRNERGVSHLHGGKVGYDKLIFNCAEHTDSSLTLTLTDDGSGSGYPGVLEVSVRFTVAEDALLIEYSAVGSEDTPFNPTNHCYFNLGGVGSGDILDTRVHLYASKYLPVDHDLIPTGVIRPVTGTAFDFATAPKAIGKEIDAKDQQLVLGGGYDHTFCVDGEGFRPVCQAYSPKSGIFMTTFSNEPGVQLYTGNFLHTTAGKAAGGMAEGYNKYDGFCLETQHYPDAVHQPQFPSVLLKAGEKFESKTAYSFAKESE